MKVRVALKKKLQNYLGIFPKKYLNKGFTKWGMGSLFRKKKKFSLLSFFSSRPTDAIMVILHRLEKVLGSLMGSFTNTAFPTFIESIGSTLGK